MRRIYTLLLFALCVLSASAQLHMYLVSDSICEVSDPHYKGKDTGFARDTVCSTGMIDLSTDYRHFKGEGGCIQVTDSPIYIAVYDEEEDKVYWLKAVDVYFDFDIVDNQIVPTSGYKSGQWIPSNSKWYSEKGWNKYYSDRLTKKYDIMELWWSLYDLTEIPYDYFIMDPGLYYMEAYIEPHDLGYVFDWYKLGNLDPLPYPDVPSVRWQSRHTINNSTVNVNVYYTYYTIRGYDHPDSYYWETEKYKKANGQFTSGEYEGCYYIKVEAWNSEVMRFHFERPQDMSWYTINKDNNYAFFDVWYDLVKMSDEHKPYDAIALGTNIFTDYYAIWDMENNRVKFIKGNELNSILTAVEVPYAIPEETPYYTLGGNRVTTPIPGQIYIHNGKKIVYKSDGPFRYNY